MGGGIGVQGESDGDARPWDEQARRDKLMSASTGPGREESNAHETNAEEAEEGKGGSRERRKRPGGRGRVGPPRGEGGPSCSRPSCTNGLFSGTFVSALRVPRCSLESVENERRCRFKRCPRFHARPTACTHPSSLIAFPHSALPQFGRPRRQGNSGRRTDEDRESEGCDAVAHTAPSRVVSLAAATCMPSAHACD